MSDIDRTVKAMAENTAANFHTEAYILWCEYLGASAIKLKHQFTRLLLISNKVGYSDDDHSRQLSELYHGLKILSERVLSPRAHKALYSVT
jgi:hypothetical protein